MIQEIMMEPFEVGCADSCALCKRSYYCKHCGEEGYFCDRGIIDYDDGEMTPSEIEASVEYGVHPARFYGA